jgi:hypothetical protein
MRHSFTIEKSGIQYQCVRDVTGTRVLRQTVHVIGIGSEPDPASYGINGHPSATMEGIARLIANEIVRNGLSQKAEFEVR